MKSEGIGVFLISRDVHDVFDLPERVAAMKNGKVVSTARKSDVSHDDVLGMIVAGKCPKNATSGLGAMREVACSIDVAAMAATSKRSCLVRPCSPREIGSDVRQNNRGCFVPRQSTCALRILP